MTIRIGTSGWYYRHWVGTFYPDAVSPRGMLAHYSREFDTVEVNSSFYGLPDTGTLTSWRDAVPDGFIFAFKASRYITHMKKLSGTDDALHIMIERARSLGEKLGPVLFQLPPRWRVDCARLGAFLEHVPKDVRVAFEFRDPSWFRGSVYELLQQYRAGFCIYDMGGEVSPCEATADFVYLRLHGPDGPYRGSYDIQTLGRWAGAICVWEMSGRDVYCFFDNDERGFAVQNARDLKKILSDRNDVSDRGDGIPGRPELGTHGPGDAGAIGAVE